MHPIGPAPARKPSPQPHATISRSRDRALTAVGLAVAGAFLLAAMVAMFLPTEARHGLWLPLHLALAGGATTAIAAALPFFSSSLLMTQPARPALRALAIGLVAGSTTAIALGVSIKLGGVSDGLKSAGGFAFLTGMVVLGWVTFWPVRGSMRKRHAIVLIACAAAIVDVAFGAMLATLLVGGYPPVVRAWHELMPAHAWLNLLGFVSLTIAGTLVHLFPTVFGTRIPASDSAAGRSAAMLVGCFVAAPPIVASGYWLSVDLLVRIGAALELAGVVALAFYAVAVWRARGRWTTDRGWHTSIIGHLSASIGWFIVGAGLAAWRTFGFGADPAGWSIEVVVAPLVLGSVVQAIVGSWTHLVPSIGPGDSHVHARQRVLLGDAARIRLVAFQAATLLLAVGLPLGIGFLTLSGVILGATVGTSSLGLLLKGLVQARGSFRAPPGERARARG